MLKYNVPSLPFGYRRPRFFAAILAVAATVFLVAGCSDDDGAAGRDDTPTETVDTTAISLTYHNFIADDDVLIMDADTTMLSVSKSLTEKLGITAFNGRPMVVWQKISRLPFIRRVTSERLEGGRYILTVDNSASLADVLPDADLNFDTEIYVNPMAAKAMTRAGGSNLVEDISTRYMEGDTIHPAVILYTDPRGYDSEIIVVDDSTAEADLTRAAGGDGFPFASAEDMVKSNASWKIIGVNSSFSKKIKFGSQSDTLIIGMKVPLKVNVNAKLAIKTKWLKLKSFDMGIYGDFSFSPEVTIGYSKALSIPSDKGTRRLVDFASYTMVFMAGPIPVCVSFNPGITLKAEAKVKGSVYASFSYKYANEFSAGVKFEDSWKGYSSYKEKANTFTANPFNTNAKLETGLGIYLSCEALLYGFAGPEIAVGPRVGFNAEASIGVGTQSKAKFEAQAKAGVYALLGAKLKIWKWKLASWNTTLTLGPEWTIWKYSIEK